MPTVASSTSWAAPPATPPPRARCERIAVSVHASPDAASKAVAAEIAALIRQRAEQNRMAVLGLATGSTPLGVYQELVRLHQHEHLSFRNVVVFNLDEYWPMNPEELQSYRRFMRENLFDLLDVEPQNVHVPDGTLPRESIAAFCEDYERRIREAGGIDLQILGVGRTGHIGFNEPGSPRDSRTRLITLDRVTRMDAASDFFGEWNVPRQAITMGVGTILEGKRIALLAFGEHKAAIVRKAVEEDVTPAVAASFLQQHPNARLVLDPAAAAELTRFKTPWLLGAIEDFGHQWDIAMTRRAVIWLARTLDKPILKLTNEDYNERGLQDLLTARGGQRGAYDINLEVFRTMQKTITGWPGGKPDPAQSGAGLSGAASVGQASVPANIKPVQAQRPAPLSANSIFPKRIVVFSPHPDDDVISMGGTLIRLCEQGHEVHVAYQTSGNIAVWDESALRHADFVSECAAAFGVAREPAESIEQRIERFIAAKKPGQIDSPELQKIKSLIRRSEARAAARHSGVDPANIHFLDLPFYETGRVRKRPIDVEDVRITLDLLERVQPHQIYAAGDLSDPHGTHRVCLTIIARALAQLTNDVTNRRIATRPRASLDNIDNDNWLSHCTVWLYRGAWQEWGPEEIEVAVPLSPDELHRKRIAIFKHESQKDYALFPGPSDRREFWQRAEDRNRHTAHLYDQLGLAEYEAIEAFVRWRPEEWNAVAES